jgi:hypothetical protein
MSELKLIMTNEEYRRLRKYTSLVSGSKGRIDILTLDEKHDFSDLLKKFMSGQDSFGDTKLYES